ncbi:MAG: hypothetical protein ABI597_00045 [Gammaproteobacteria bacterium]
MPALDFIAHIVDKNPDASLRGHGSYFDNNYSTKKAKALAFAGFSITFLQK